MTQRYGCYYCFQTLDPGDAQTETSRFLQCPNCQAVYHEVCWHNHDSCLRCGISQATPMPIAQPPPLLPTSLTKAARIRPSAVVRVSNDTTESIRARQAREKGIVQVLWVVVTLQVALLLVFLVGVAVYIDLAGSAGGALLLAAYALISYRKLTYDSMPYQLLNVCGGFLLVINSIKLVADNGYYGALPLVIINVLWILIGVVTLARTHRARASIAGENTDDPEP